MTSGSGALQASRHQAFLGQLRRYAEARNRGLDRRDAARETGIDPFRTADRYERWYRAGMADVKGTGT